MEQPIRTHGDVDPAVRDARLVVGLYGDPHVSWSILLELELRAPLDPTALASRLAALHADQPHLGRPGTLQRFGSEERGPVVAALADEGYGDHDPLLRVALAEDGRLLVVAGHHGALDGLGLVGAAGLLVDRPLGTGARGVGRTGREAGFWGRAGSRLVEALLHPPARFAAAPLDPATTGDHLAVATLPPGRAGTAELAWATTDALRGWSDRSGGAGRRTVLAMGVSRRPGSAPIRPDRDTGYLRARTDRVRSAAETAAVLRGTALEPDFPPGEGGVVARVAALLADRLGASALVSNLGRLDGADDVVAARFWPAASGPAGVALGLVTAGDRSALTVRARRAWFDRSTTERLLREVADRMPRAGSVGSAPQ